MIYKLLKYCLFTTLFISTNHAATCSAMPISLDSTIIDSLTSDCNSTHRVTGYAKYYTFTLNTQQAVDITMHKERGDTFLFLENDAGDVIASNDDAYGYNAGISLILDAGTYTIDATSYQYYDEISNFELTLRKAYDIEGVKDFNSDGIADIFIREKTGKLSLWLMNANGTHTTKYLGELSDIYSIEGIADFDSNDRPDILIRRDDGKMYIWYMYADGTHTTTVIAKLFNASTNSYKIEGLGNFDNDGEGITDIIITKNDRDMYIWHMDLAGGHTFTKFYRMGYDDIVKYIGDFNHDGIDDIYITNEMNNYSTILYMNADGTYRKEQVNLDLDDFISNYIALDFNNDGGLPDFIHQLYSTNMVLLTQNEDRTFMSLEMHNSALTPEYYHILNISDFNGDNIPDLLIRRGDGKMYIWYMNADGSHRYRVIN